MYTSFRYDYIGKRIFVDENDFKNNMNLENNQGEFSNRIPLKFFKNLFDDLIQYIYIN